MRFGGHYVFVGAIALSCIASVASSQDDEGSVRLQTEASGLLKIVVGRDPTSPCSVDEKWDSYPVPESTARKNLGSTLHADLVAPFDSTSLRDLVAPAHGRSDAFCNAQQRDQLWATKRKDFEPSSEPRLHLGFIRTTFPVFSTNYVDAVLILTSENHDFFRLDGKVNGPSLFTSVQAVAFHKIGGMWSEIGSETLATAE